MFRNGIFAPIYFAKTHNSCPCRLTELLAVGSKQNWAISENKRSL